MTEGDRTHGGLLLSDRIRGLAVRVGVVVFASILGALFLWMGGYDAGAAARAMVRGSFGSWDTFVSITLVRSVPLILTGLAVGLAFRAGIWNIGAEGQLYAGAIGAAWVALSFPGLPAWVLVPMVMVSAAIGGALWALIPTLMRLRLGVGEVITTILMNFLGVHLASYIVHGPLQESTGVFPQTDRIAEHASLPIMLPGTRLHWGFGLAVIVAAGLAVIFRRARFGFQLRAVGSSLQAAASSGRINVRRVIFITFLGSGAIAGIAGGAEVAGVTFALYEGLSPGWGYTAIAVALLAGLDPLGIVFSGILFAALHAGSAAMQRDAGVPLAWVGVVEAIVILTVLVIIQKRHARSDGGGL
jgi:ABC-type uncharacterized transport system permease subunit